MAKSDGAVIIQAKLETKEFDKDLNSLSKRLAELTEKATADYELNGVKITGGWNLSGEEQKEFEQISAEIDKIIEKQRESAELEKETAIQARTQTTAQTEVTNTVQEQKTAWQLLLEKQENLNGMIKEYRQMTSQKGAMFDYDRNKAEDLRKSIIETAKELEKLTGERVTIKGIIEMPNQLEDVKKQLKSIGNSIEGITKKVIRWGLSILGIRGAYSAIRRAMSLVSSQNEEVANKMQQMRSVLVGVLVPAVQAVVNWLAKAMVYINYIFKVITGKNLFNFADATKNASKNLADGASGAGGIAKNLKEAQKQLAGFDEMNMLQEDKSSGGGGGVGGIDASEFGNIFDDLQNMTIPKWVKDLANLLKTILKYWKQILTVAVAFGVAIKAMQIAKFVEKLGLIGKMAPATQAGIGLITAGVVALVGSIINLIVNWDKMTQKEKTITGMLAGIGGAFVALGTAIALGISVATLGIGALIAVIVALATAIATLTIKQELNSRAVMDNTKQEEINRQAKEKAKQAYDNLIDAVDRQAEAERNLTEAQNRTGESGEALWQSVENGTLTYEQMTEQQRETYKAYKELIEANENLKKANEEKIKSDSASIKSDFDVQIANDKTGKTYDKLKEDIIQAWKDGKISTEDARDSIERMTGQMEGDMKTKFTEDIPNDIKDGLNPNKYTSAWDTFKNGWNRFIDGLKKTIGIEVNTKYKNGGGSGTGFAKGGIVVPRLASGGIINQPGKGVPIGQAIGGERGMEGVIPLTDSQQMELLGEAIGKYITINANITNSMNGKIISRELQRINNENNFASNR